MRRVAARLLVVLPLLHGGHRVAAAPEPIVLGQSLPLQIFDVDQRGEHALTGANAFVEAVNQRGGIGGRPLQLVTLNSKGDPVRHRQNLVELLTVHRAVAWLNCIGDEACHIAAEEAQRRRVPLVGVIAGSPTLVRSRQPLVFRIRPTHEREAEALARQLQALALSRVALVVDGSAPQPRPETAPLVQAVQAALAARGVAGELVPLGDDAAAHASAMTSLAKHRAAIVLLPATLLTRLVEQGRDRDPGWPGTLLVLADGSRNLMQGSFVRNLIGFTSVVPNPDDGSLSLTREFQRAAEISGGPMATNATGFEAYIAVRVVAEALRRGPRADREALVSALEGLGDLDLGGLRLNFARARASGSGWIEIDMRPPRR